MGATSMIRLGREKPGMVPFVPTTFSKTLERFLVAIRDWNTHQPGPVLRFLLREASQVLQRQEFSKKQLSRILRQEAAGSPRGYLHCHYYPVCLTNCIPATTHAPIHAKALLFHAHVDLPLSTAGPMPYSHHQTDARVRRRRWGARHGSTMSGKQGSLREADGAHEEASGEQ